MLMNDFKGLELSRLGFGTMRLPVRDGNASDIDEKQVDEMVDYAIANGINYFDTAYPYHGGMSEKVIGRSLSRYPRESYYLATKYPGHQISSSYDPAAVFEEQLKKCGVDYFDLLLIHQPAGNYKAGYRLMEKAYKAGKVKAIGLSNFNREQVQEILDSCEVKPAVLQTEVHPYFQEKELKTFLEKEGMVIQAWYPLGHGDKALIEEPVFTELAEKYGKSNAQVILRWHIQAGNIVIPGSKNPDHIRDNFALFDFALTDEEMARVAAMDKNKRYYTSTPQMLEGYVKMVPPVDEQK